MRHRQHPNYTLCTTKLFVVGVHWFHSVCLSDHLSVCPSACRGCCVTPTVLDGFFPYQAQMTPSMREGVMHNDLWPWPISSMWFNHDCNKTAKICHILPVRSTAHTIMDEFVPYWEQIITSIRGCVVQSDLWPWPISSRSFSHDFAI